VPITIAFVINGIAAARVFQRLCMGRPTELNIVAENIDTQVQYTSEASVSQLLH
jgi:NADH-quinone oxidoreductase subunit L